MTTTPYREIRFVDLVGTRCLEAFWAGTREQSFHPLCTEACYPHCGYDLAPSGMEVRHFYAVIIKVDGRVFRFDQGPATTGLVRDVSTYANVFEIDGGERALSNIAWPANAPWPWDLMFDPPLLVEFRVTPGPDEILYATSEQTGECVLYVGTEFDTDEVGYLGAVTDVSDFIYDFKDGTPLSVPWLDPVDDGPQPMEIPGRKPREFKQQRNPNWTNRMKARHAAEERQSRRHAARDLHANRMREWRRRQRRWTDVRRMEDLSRG